MGWKAVIYDGKNKMKNMPIGDLDTSDQGWCEYSSVGFCSKPGSLPNGVGFCKSDQSPVLQKPFKDRRDSTETTVQSRYGNQGVNPT